MEYFAKITRARGGGFSVVFADCPGCQTCGDSLEEAKAMARDALDGWLVAHLTSGKAPPRPKISTGTAVHVAPRVASAVQFRWARQQLGLTQPQLATRIGVPQRQIAKVEDPLADPSLRTLEKVARALGLRLDVSLSAS